MVRCDVLSDLDCTKAALATAAHTEATCAGANSVGTLWCFSTTLYRTRRTRRSTWPRAHGGSWTGWAHSAGQPLDHCSVMPPSRTATHLDSDQHPNLSAGNANELQSITRKYTVNQKKPKKHIGYESFCVAWIRFPNIASEKSKTEKETALVSCDMWTCSQNDNQIKL